MITFLKNKIITTLLVLILLGHGTMQSSITQAKSYACALTSSGNLIAAGSAINNTSNTFIVARYLTNGIVDTSFGSAGIVTTLIGTRAEASDMLIQSDGKIVLAGFAMMNGITQVAIARYLASNGSLDSTFGTGGIVTTQVGNGVSINGLAIDSNNALLLTGTSVQSGSPQILVMRYTSTGSLDTSFNTTGIVLLPLGARAAGTSLAIQPSDNKVLVAGYYVDPLTGSSQSIITRYNTDGTIDQTFGTDGIANCPIFITRITLKSDGSIIACGSSGSLVALAQFSSTGILDNTFGSGGIVVSNFGNQSGANDLIIDSNNKIVITGFCDAKLLVARYTAAGNLDTTFNGTGSTTLLFESTNVGNSLVLQADGKILIAGYADDDYLIARYLTTGIIDPTWGINGIVGQPSGTPGNSITRVWDQKAVGSNGGTFTSGAWQTRTLNQLNTTDSSITLSNNQFTLAAGLYEIQIIAPAYRVGNHQVRLQNITDGLTAMVGTTAFSNASIGSMTSSYIYGQLSVSKLTTFAVQHMCSTTELNDGFGIAAGFGSAEIYTSVSIVQKSS